MPKINRRHVTRREWAAGHKDYLRCGLDIFREAWGREPADGWPADTLAEMHLAWEHFRDELLAEFRTKLEMPWAWWKFDATPAVLSLLDASTFDTDQEREAEALDRAGLLAPEALAKAANDHRLTAGPQCDASYPPFRRRWGWWRFTSPERRNYAKPEAVQLVEVERRGGEVLNAREKSIAENKLDPMVEKAAAFNAARVFLTAAEVEALGLPELFIELEHVADDQ